MSYQCFVHLKKVFWSLKAYFNEVSYQVAWFSLSNKLQKRWGVSLVFCFWLPDAPPCQQSILPHTRNMQGWLDTSSISQVTHVSNLIFIHFFCSYEMLLISLSFDLQTTYLWRHLAPENPSPTTRRPMSFPWATVLSPTHPESLTSTWQRWSFLSMTWTRTQGLQSLCRSHREITARKTT